MNRTGNMDRARNTYIDLLRAAAILPVLMAHWTDSNLTKPGLAILDRSYLYLAAHDNGVSLFFVISGFVITHAAMTREHNLFGLSYRTFYPRRFARIAPLFTLVCIIGIGLLTFSNPFDWLTQFTIRNPAAVFDAAFWASIFTFTFNVWRIANIGMAPGWGLHWDVMWSLAVEEQFYIAFPLLIFLAKNRARLQSILWGIVLVSITYRLAHRWNYSPYDSLICFELIASGILAATYASTLSASLRSPLAVLGAVLLCIGFFNTRANELALFNREFLAAGTGLLLCCSLLAPNAKSIFLRPIAFIGELSYGMYLLHAMVLYTIGDALAPLGYIVGYVVFVLATAAVATLSYRCFEKPSERFIRSALTVQRPDAAAETPAIKRGYSD